MQWSHAILTFCAATTALSAVELNLPVGDADGADAPFIASERGSQSRPDARFVDANGRLTYAFDTRNLTRLVCHLTLANNFRVQLSSDGERWFEVLNAMTLYGRDRHDGETAEHEVDASEYLPCDRLYLRFRDASPFDGWGAYIARIRLEAEGPADHDWLTSRALSENPGVLADWVVLGSFAATNHSALLSTVVEGIEPATLIPGAERAWKSATAVNQRVSLRAAELAFDPVENAIAFAHTFIYVPEVTDARLLLGSDDAIATYLNGSRMLSHEVRRGCRDADDDVRVRLGSGWNRLLLVVGNGGAAWEFTARLVDLEGNAITDLRTQARNPLPNAAPFPTPEVPAEVTLVSARVGANAARVDNGGVRITLQVTTHNPGTATVIDGTIRLKHGNEVIQTWPPGRVPGGTGMQNLWLEPTVWTGALLAASAPLTVSLNEAQVALKVEPCQRLLADLLLVLPEDLGADLEPLLEVQRWWNSTGMSAAAQREQPRQGLIAALEGRWDDVRQQARDLAAMPITRSWSTCFQCAAPYGEDFDVQPDAVLVYGLADTAARVRQWRRHGYQTQLMTGIAWGGYQDYLYGRFDGLEHLDDAQMDREGQRISHGGDIYYMVPTKPYTDFLCQFIGRSFDVPLDGVCLEEPEFWMRGGWSPAFRREWEAFYGEAWTAPDSSYTACYRASKLRKELYRRCLQDVCDYVKENKPQWEVTVATHSLINYANWGIASPESALADIASCDTVIAQVWTDTILTPCRSEGHVGVRPFAMAYLEFAQMVGMITPTGKSLAFLADPVSDNPMRQWSTYRRSYEHTIAAALCCGDVTRFEIMPWPDRVLARRYLQEVGNLEVESRIPEGYGTSLLAVVNALRDMPKGEQKGVGIAVSDSLMYQRGAVNGQSGTFDDLYGLTLPLVRQGLLPAFVQLEHISTPEQHVLTRDMGLLLLTYNGQKPPSGAVHDALARWVREGGALLFFSDGKDPFAHVPEWWNAQGTTDALPREHLFATLGLGTRPEPGWHAVDQGWIHISTTAPAQFTELDGHRTLMDLVKEGSRRRGNPLPTKENNWVAVERGPYLIASTWDDPTIAAPFSRKGLYLDLFGDQLDLTTVAQCAPGKSGLWLDVRACPTTPHVMLTASRVTGWQASPGNAAYVSRGPAGTRALSWVRLPSAPTAVQASRHTGEPMEVSWTWEPEAQALRLAHDNLPDGVWVALRW